MNDAVELGHLKYFYAVAKHGSFTAASESLLIQQPTVSKMVRLLEEQLGMTLLERHKRGVRLTRAGTEVYQACQSIFDRVDAIRSLSETQRRECQGKLTFGAPSSVSTYIVPAALKKFLRENPRAQASIFAGTSNLIRNEIYDGRIEFGLFFEVQEKQDFQVTPLLDVPFKLVISAAADEKSVRQSLIIARRSDYGKATPFPVQEMLAKNSVKIRTVISSNNLESQRALVCEGLGVALLPAFMVRRELAEGTFKAIHPRKNFSYTLKLITRKGKLLSQDAAVFLEHFKEAAQERMIPVTRGPQSISERIEHSVPKTPEIWGRLAPI